MADELTPIYGMYCPRPDQVMNDPVRFLNDNWDQIEAAANPTVITAPPLPQSGSYIIGDRVYLSDAAYKSGFILWSKDANWGWIWRPIEAALAPWITVPATAIKDTAYEQHPTKPLQITLDNRGNCYWRGAIRKKTVGLTNNNSLEIFQNLPDALRGNNDAMHTLAIDPATPQSDLGLAGYKGGRIYISPDGYNSCRFHNAGTAQDIYFQIEYNCCTGYSLGP